MSNSSIKAVPIYIRPIVTRLQKALCVCVCLCVHGKGLSLLATCNPSTKNIKSKSHWTPQVHRGGSSCPCYLSFQCAGMSVSSRVCPFARYMAAAVALDQETNGGVRRFEVCDNIDLEMVLMEYESYHYVKFQRYPKLIRRTAEPGIRPLLKH